MDELFDQLELEISECKTSMSEYDRNLNKCLGKYEIKSIQETYQTVIYSQTNQNCQNAPSFSFTKTSRFREPQKDNLINELPLNVSISSIKQAQPSVTFTKSQRFQETKVIPTTPLEPNYDFVKRKASSVVISDSKIRDDDVSTQASMITVGPGSYEVDIKEKKQSNRTFAKDERFLKLKANNQEAINPNYNSIRPNIPIPKISKPIKKNKYQIQRDEINRMNEQLRLEEYRRRPLELDKAIRQNITGVVIKQAYNDFNSHPKGSKMRRFLIRKLLDDIQAITVGPGQYEIHEEKQPCMVVFKSHSTERRIPPDRPVPGPDYYYSKDDYIKPNPIQVKFGKEERIKKIKKEDLDMRPNLEVNVDPIKTKAPDAVRWDIEPTKPRMTFEIEDKVAPGYYDPSHVQVDPAIKGVKIAPLNEKNDRINVIDPTKGKDFNDYEEQLYPTLDGVKPQIQTFKYHEDTDVKPIHPPDKELFPEQHKFYDVNMDAIREQLVQDIQLAGKKGRGLKEWLQYFDDMTMFKKYMQRRNKQPEIGEYDVQFKQIDKDLKTVNFNRYVEIDHDPIQKPDGPLDGDNLILNPDKPKPHIPTLDFEKQSDPRPEPEIKEVELLLNVDYAPIKPRVKNIPNFEKQLERPEGPQIKDQEAIIEPKFDQVEKRVIGNVNFEKQPERADDPRYQPKVDNNVLQIEVKPPRDERTAVQMNSKTKRFGEKQGDNDQQQQQQVPAAINISKIEKAEKAIRPNIPGVNLSKQSGRKDFIIKQKK
ncbi:unnamed protein product [Paramecium primaurelia]|uniref:Uncharacterized protein n=1 Tax=Paramecium primaurelia TaxID=5886 RepID=A0A8S1MD10_PARPR|nr:unnamed protein product [Paramecium primaurelia]